MSNVLPFIARPQRAISELIVHCTATPEGRPVTVAQIRQWHKARGWSDIGYHYVIGLDGSINSGRSLAQVGAHVAGRNTGTIGIAYVGGVAADSLTPKDTRTVSQKAALIWLMLELSRKIPTITLISGHRDYAAKACPSFDARREYRDLISNARRAS